MAGVMILRPGKPSKIGAFEIMPLGDVIDSFEGLHISLVDVAPRSPSKEMHRHDSDAELWLIASGKGLVVYDGGKEATVKAGDVIYCPKGGEHHIRNIGDDVLSVFNIHISLSD